jgi:hypothetical protein
MLFKWSQRWCLSIESYAFFKSIKAVRVKVGTTFWFNLFGSVAQIALPNSKVALRFHSQTPGLRSDRTHKYRNCTPTALQMTKIAIPKLKLHRSERTRSAVVRQLRPIWLQSEKRLFGRALGARSERKALGQCCAREGQLQQVARKTNCQDEGLLHFAKWHVSFPITDSIRWSLSPIGYRI